MNQSVLQMQSQQKESKCSYNYLNNYHQSINQSSFFEVLRVLCEQPEAPDNPTGRGAPAKELPPLPIPDPVRIPDRRGRQQVPHELQEEVQLRDLR